MNDTYWHCERMSTQAKSSLEETYLTSLCFSVLSILVSSSPPSHHLPPALHPSVLLLLHSSLSVVNHKRITLCTGPSRSCLELMSQDVYVEGGKLWCCWESVPISSRACHSFFHLNAPHMVDVLQSWLLFLQNWDPASSTRCGEHLMPLGTEQNHCIFKWNIKHVYPYVGKIVFPPVRGCVKFLRDSWAIHPVLPNTSIMLCKWITWKQRWYEETFACLSNLMLQT